MPENEIHSTKANVPPTQNYGLGFLIGILTGLAAYFFYGTKKGSYLRAKLAQNELDNLPARPAETTIQSLRRHIARIQAVIEPFLETKPTDKQNQKPKNKPPLKPTHRYFTARK